MSFPFCGHMQAKREGDISSFPRSAVVGVVLSTQVSFLLDDEHYDDYQIDQGHDATSFRRQLPFPPWTGSSNSGLRGLELGRS